MNNMAGYVPDQYIGLFYIGMNTILQYIGLYVYREEYIKGQYFGLALYNALVSVVSVLNDLLKF